MLPKIICLREEMPNVFFFYNISQFLITIFYHRIQNSQLDRKILKSEYHRNHIGRFSPKRQFFPKTCCHTQRSVFFF